MCAYKHSAIGQSRTVAIWSDAASPQMGVFGLRKKHHPNRTMPANYML